MSTASIVWFVLGFGAAYYGIKHYKATGSLV